jgi:hypothetical protein
VPLFLKRQCDRTLPAKAQAAAAEAKAAAAAASLEAGSYRELLLAKLLVGEAADFGRQTARYLTHPPVLARADDGSEVGLGFYPFVAAQYSSTTLHQVSDHIQSLFSKALRQSDVSLGAVRHRHRRGA